MNKLKSAFWTLLTLVCFGTLSTSLFAAAEGPTPSATDDFFTIAVLPDTQYYAESFPEIFRSQTQWIADTVRAESTAPTKTWNIKFVLNLGDITNTNATEQWQRAREAYSLIRGVVPWAITVGNHDLSAGGSASDRSTQFNRYFSASEFPNLVSVYRDGALENSAHRIEIMGETYLFLMLEFGPRNEVIEWAQNVVRANPQAKAILATHAYMFTDNTRTGEGDQHNPHAYPLAHTRGETVNDGEELWEKLIFPNPSIFMVLNGHHLGSGVGRLVSTSSAGSPVYQMLSNYQMRPRGGEGYLRLLRFEPRRRRVEVYTYSPFLNRYMTQPKHRFRTDLRQGAFVSEFTR